MQGDSDDHRDYCGVFEGLISPENKLLKINQRRRATKKRVSHAGPTGGVRPKAQTLFNPADQPVMATSFSQILWVRDVTEKALNAGGITSQGVLVGSTVLGGEPVASWHCM